MSNVAKDEVELVQWMAKGICCGNLSCENKDCHIDPICNAHNVLAAIRAAGWAVVPVEPTDVMFEAGHEEFWEGKGIVDIYRAMLAAAPGVKL
jgi:hypothetical protein